MISTENNLIVTIKCVNGKRVVSGLEVRGLGLSSFFGSSQKYDSAKVT